MKRGIYQHLKTGKMYKVIGIAKHSETLENFVVYEALYNNLKSKLWIRPLKMFSTRFKFIKNVYTTDKKG